MTKYRVTTVPDPTRTIHLKSLDARNGTLYFDKEGNRIPLIDVVTRYKPEYDTESSYISDAKKKHQTLLYRDVYTEIADIRSRLRLVCYIRMIIAWQFDLWIGRFFKPSIPEPEEP